jgi:hypothetical protein
MIPYSKNKYICRNFFTRLFPEIVQEYSVSAFIPCSSNNYREIIRFHHSIITTSKNMHYLPNVRRILPFDGGLLDRYTARYVYKQLKASLHKPTSKLLENVFSKKCVFKNNLQLLEKKFLSQTNTTPKNGILLNKMAHLLKSSMFQ